MTTTRASDLCFMSAMETLTGLRARTFQAVDVAEAVLARIEDLESVLNCFTEVFPDDYMSAARATDERLQVENAGILDGITFSVKDLIAMAGVRLTRGSTLFRDYVPHVDAPVVERTRAAGGLIVGKTTTSELGWKCVTDSPLFGPTRNPWDVARTPGGSSGGAAVSVAAGLSTIGIGTDAGGSIRIPASFCGVVGLKPTFGAIPIHPTPAAASIVHVGIAARTIDDAALALAFLGGPDSRDRFSVRGPLSNPRPTLSSCASIAALRDLRVGWTTDFGTLPVVGEVGGAIVHAADVLTSRGIRVRPLTSAMPDVDQAFSVYFSAALGAQLRGVDEKQLELLDPGLQKLFEESRYITGHDLIAADLRRAVLWDYLRQVLSEFDVLMCPVAGAPAFDLGVDRPPNLSFEPETPTGWMGFTYPFNLVGLPAISVPCGRSTDGMPVGVQLVARHWDEMALFSLGKIIEEEIGSIGGPPP